MFNTREESRIKFVYSKEGLLIRNANGESPEEFLLPLEVLLFNNFAVDILKIAIYSIRNEKEFFYSSYVHKQGKFIATSMALNNDNFIFVKDNIEQITQVNKHAFLCALSDCFRRESNMWALDYVDRLYPANFFTEEEYELYKKQCILAEEGIINFCNTLDGLLERDL